ncbi:fumarylacetoacetate hydrolase family protein [Nocardia aobensis]|uniref:fumarylacetoacetate hydrolase family protein n=1 Tax=Nocardia aobensis TaxID=257277 RepID=UPI001FE04504|nr:fumarylacetoacetate hydrolase family protein [Nocardia aobensis]
MTLLPYESVSALIASGADWRIRAAELDGGRTIHLDSVDFAPLTPTPEKIICVGVNYRSHISEIGIDEPSHPTLFAKYNRSLIGAYDDIVLPETSEAVDWEVELGVVIGTSIRDVPEEEALDAVAGYTIVNDVTMRDWQFRTSQFLQGKTFEGSTPVGPFLVTPDEAEHARDLGITCSVDHDVMQKSATSELVFSVAQIISYISTFITLAPGDLIATGTPAGVGAARTPPVYLTAGNTLRSAIDGLGEQINRCVTGGSARSATKEESA